MDLFSVFYNDSDADDGEDGRCPPQDESEAKSTSLMDPPNEINEDEQKEFLLTSIQASVVIRQLRSQGLSFQLWPAAYTLVALLDGGDPSAALRLHPIIPSRQLRILELGSGTGLVGIAAAAILGARVTLTDLSHVLPNLRFNADSNAAVVASCGGSVDVRPLCWGHDEDSAALLAETAAAFDVVMASDVVYYDELIDPLLRTLQAFLKGETAFIMAHLRRWKKRDSVFFRKARKLFDVAVVHTDPPPPGSRVGVAVYRFTATKPPKYSRGISLQPNSITKHE